MHNSNYNFLYVMGPTVYDFQCETHSFDWIIPKNCAYNIFIILNSLQHNILFNSEIENKYGNPHKNSK